VCTRTFKTRGLWIRGCKLNSFSNLKIALLIELRIGQESTKAFSVSLGVGLTNERFDQLYKLLYHPKSLFSGYK
jgi:hypothetical protein